MTADIRKMSAIRNCSILPQSETDGLALIAWNLRLLRTARGYTQDELAVEARVDRKFIGWLEGRKGNPTVKMLERLATALSVPLHRFFSPPAHGSEPPEPLKCGRKRVNRLAATHVRSRLAASRRSDRRPEG
jgi:transcriptional regulator with XRE-family HTH domain